MPSSVSLALAPSDRKVLIVIGCIFFLILIAGLTFGSGAPSQGFGPPSTYSYGPGGARAAFLLLKESGYNVERWDKSPMDLPEPGEDTVLILAEPAYPAADEERQALTRFLRTGGRILATGSYAGLRLLPEGDAAPQEAWPGETKSYSALLPSPITLGAAEIELVPESRWGLASSRHLALYGSGFENVVVTYRVDKGRVIWWAGAWPLTNLGISSKQNLELFLNSVGSAKDVQVLWDEYFHGERGSLWAYLRSTPVPWAGAQLLLFAVALVATFGRRWGPMRSLRTEPRLSPLEFVETLGGLYERAHAAGPAVSVAAQRFRFLLTRRLGLPGGYAAAELGRAARARLGAEAEGLAELLAPAESAAAEPRLSEAQALRLVQGLDRYAKALRLLPRPAPPQVSSPGSKQEAC